MTTSREEGLETAPVAPQRRGRNAIWLMLERVTNLGIALLVTAVVARALGPVDYGRIAVALALFALLMPISNITAQCLIRDVVAGPKSANALFTAAELAAGAITSTIVVIVFAVVALTVGVSSSTGVVTIVIVGSALLRPLQVVDAWFVIRSRSKRVVLIRIAGVLVAGSVRVALPLLGFGVLAVAWTYLVESVLTSIGTWIAYRRSERNYRWEVDLARMRGLLKELAPLLLASSSALIFQRLDQVMLAWLSNLSEAGVFAASSSLAEAPRFPLVAIAVSVTPHLVALKHTDPERYRRDLIDLARFVTLFGYALTIGLILIMAPLAPIVLGPQYADARIVIIILALSTPPACLGAVLLLVTNWDKLYREAVIRNGIAAALSVGLNFVLLPRYGAIGAAITTFVAVTWVYVLGAAAARRTRPIFWMTVPTLEPISSTRTFLAHRREDKLARETQYAEDVRKLNEQVDRP